MSSDFEVIVDSLRERLLAAPEVNVGKWQSQDVSNRPDMITREIRHVNIMWDMPYEIEDLVPAVKPNLPWAEDHFQERIGGEPLNPPPSEAWWPYAQQGNAEHKEGVKFSHTYPERIWPKRAGEAFTRLGGHSSAHMNKGIRYNYGDLNDVIKLLQAERYTRQAYLPIWFPEDTGNALGVRVPCTLGYHFLIRGDILDISYFIRSCDFVRHFRDDVYMAVRLAQWVVQQIDPSQLELGLGKFVMQIPSLHIFRGDVYKLEQEQAAVKKRRLQEQIANINGFL
jgi:hypothetical protein